MQLPLYMVDSCLVEIAQINKRQSLKALFVQGFSNAERGFTLYSLLTGLWEGLATSCQSLWESLLEPNNQCGKEGGVRPVRRQLWNVRLLVQGQFQWGVSTKQFFCVYVPSVECNPAVQYTNGVCTTLWPDRAICYWRGTLVSVFKILSPFRSRQIPWELGWSLIAMEPTWCSLRNSN